MSLASQCRSRPVQRFGGVGMARRTRIAGAGLALSLLLGGSLAVGPASPVHASAPSVTTSGELPPGLQPTEVDITNDTAHRYGEPELAVSPKNPNNLVYMIMQESYTYACQAAHDAACTNGGTTGLLTIPGFIYAKLFVSFDR